MSESLSTSMLRVARAGKLALVELVLPPVCRLCNAPVGSLDDFCRGCESALSASQSMMRGACLRCGMPPRGSSRVAPSGLHAASANATADEDSPPAGASEGAVCRHCCDDERWFDQVVALWSYQDRVCDAVVAAKYPKNAALADALGRRLGAALLERCGDSLPDLVTCVPSHLTRRVARGGNGTAVIATAFAQTIERPFRNLLRTTRAIAKQAWLDDQQRLKNVHGAFSVKKRYAFSRTPEPPNRHILVIDDVLTTGATANEVARVLCGSGVRRVSLAVVARAIRSR